MAATISHPAAPARSPSPTAAAVSNATGYVGCSDDSTGIVAISGAGSTWTNSGDLYVGYSGAGTVTQTGGTNSVAGALCLGYAPTGSGVYNLNGGVLAIHALSGGSGTAHFNFGGGTILATGTFSTSLPMTLTGTGGNATIDTQGYAVTLSGVLSGTGGLIKSGAGRLTLSAANGYNGRTTVTAGTIELATAAQNTVFSLGGADVQGGKMIFDYNGVISPAATIQSLLTASCHGGLWNIGRFRSSTAASTGLTLGWFDNPAAHSVTVMATYAGDFNLDGVVNNLDLDIWTANFGVRHGLATRRRQLRRRRQRARSRSVAEEHRQGAPRRQRRRWRAPRWLRHRWSSGARNAVAPRCRSA